MARVILAVDTAANSGWCLFVDGGYVSSGECKAIGAEPRIICHRALELDPKATLVLERPWGGSMHTLVGLGAAKGQWESAWVEACGTKTLVRVKRVFPQVWRAALLGSTAKNPLAERLRASVHAGRRTGPDESPAVLIAEYAIQLDQSQTGNTVVSRRKGVASP